MNAAIRFITAAAVLGLWGCTSVQEEIKDTLDIEAPPVLQEERAPRGVAVPDLDQRSQDDQFLSRIEQLDRDLFASRQNLKEAREKLEDAETAARTARESEARMAAELEQVQGLLKGAQEREKELHAQLLRARIETLRAKQEINRFKIRDLTTGTANR